MGLGFGVQDLRLGVKREGFRDWGLKFRAKG
jgi:hypothetical protein